MWFVMNSNEMRPLIAPSFGSLLVVAIRLRVVGERLTPVLQAPRACMAGVHTKRRK